MWINASTKQGSALVYDKISPAFAKVARPVNRRASGGFPDGLKAARAGMRAGVMF